MFQLKVKFSVYYEKLFFFYWFFLNNEIFKVSNANSCNIVVIDFFLNVVTDAFFSPACNKGCPRIYRPVCGTDGKTYANQCLLDIAKCKSGGKIRRDHIGRCNKSKSKIPKLTVKTLKYVGNHYNTNIKQNHLHNNNSW